MTKKMIFQALSDPKEVIEIEVRSDGITARRPGQDSALTISLQQEGKAKSSERADRPAGDL